MATKIQIRRGDKENLPDLDEGELGFAVDTNEVFIGTSTTTNVQILTGDAGVAPEAAQAVKLKTARAIALLGDVTGTANFDGSANISITATVVDNSHNHVISNIDSLQDTLGTKLEQADLDDALSDYATTAALDLAIQALDAATADANHNHTLDDLENVSISDLADGDVLKWDSELGKWTNQDDAFGGEGGTETDPVFTSHTTSNITDGTGFLKNNGSGTWSYDNNTYLTSSSTLPGTQVTSSGVANGRVLTANGSGASTWQTPVVYEWQFIKAINDTTDPVDITSTELGEIFDLSSYDYKFVYTNSTNTYERSNYIIQLNGVTGAEYNWLYSSITKSSEAAPAISELGSRSGSLYISTGLQIDDESSGSDVTAASMEFIIERSSVTLNGSAVVSLKGEGIVNYGTTTAALNGVCMSKFSGTIRDQISLSSVRISNILDEGSSKSSRIRVYKRLR